MAVIDVLVPVLRRPQNAARLYSSLRDATAAEYRLLFLCSPGDNDEIEACIQTGADVIVVDFDPGPGDYARKMNAGFRLSLSEWVFLGADDIEFSPGWLSEALAQTGSVIGTNDMANGSVKRGEFSTHMLVSRRYVMAEGASADGPGILCHEGYDHNFPDREICGLARHRGEWAFARHSIVRHRHPLWQTAPDDSTYQKSLRHFHQDQRLFWSRSHLWNYEGLSAMERQRAINGKL